MSLLGLKELTTWINTDFFLLVNNAGIGVICPLECIPIHMAQEMMDINFFGTLRPTKAVLPSMKARQSGHIINCSSEGGIIGVPFWEAYSASKFAVEGLTESLAPMLRQFNIRLAGSLFKAKNCNYYCCGTSLE